MERKVIINGQESMPLFRTVSDAYRKKPVVVHARQIDKPFEVHTLEGIMKGKAGDWLIMGVEKELYPCDDKIFKKTYEKAGVENITATEIVMMEEAEKKKKELQGQLDRIERMLKYLIIDSKITDEENWVWTRNEKGEELAETLPDISDILEDVRKKL